MPLPLPPFDPPYHACIFVDVLTPDDNGFAARAEEMVKLAKAQPGFLGMDGARGEDGLGILVSYWRDEQSVAAWREHDRHALTREDGRSIPWYEAFSVHIAKVERSYSFTRPPGTEPRAAVTGGLRPGHAGA